MEGQILLSDYAIFKCSGIAEAQIETEWFNVCLKKKKFTFSIGLEVTPFSISF